MTTQKHKKKLILGIICMVIIAVFVLIQTIYYAPDDEVALPSSLQDTLVDRTTIYATQPIQKGTLSTYIPAFDARLTIPSLKINSHIQTVGITKKGNMATPNNFFDVGLYKYGTLPGEKGSAVIAGHVDNGLGLKAIFGNLKDIKVGDDIYVEMKPGEKLHFRVVSTAVYDFTADASGIFNQDDDTYLKIITCSGVWVQQYKTHDKRLVVTAVLVK